MSECDHRIGQYEEPGGCVDVRASERAEDILRRRAYWNKMAAQYARDHGGHHRNPFFDARCALSDDDLFRAEVATFKFCPDCGERLP